MENPDHSGGVRIGIIPELQCIPVVFGNEPGCSLAAQRLNHGADESLILGCQQNGADIRSVAGCSDVPLVGGIQLGVGEDTGTFLHIQQGGVSVADEKVTDISTKYTLDDFKGEGLIIRRGKKKFAKVVAE